MSDNFQGFGPTSFDAKLRTGKRADGTQGSIIYGTLVHYGELSRPIRDAQHGRIQERIAGPPRDVNARVVFGIDHDESPLNAKGQRGQPVGDTANGTAKLIPLDDRLDFEIYPDDSLRGKRALELVELREAHNTSFTFLNGLASYHEGARSSSLKVRQIDAWDIAEGTIANQSKAVYPDTFVGIRAEDLAELLENKQGNYVDTIKFVNRSTLHHLLDSALDGMELDMNVDQVFAGARAMADSQLAPSERLLQAIAQMSSQVEEPEPEPEPGENNDSKSTLTPVDIDRFNTVFNLNGESSNG